ncbi:hypothetical protein TWF594_006878 [Orbilia oligospora]|nr:hypothetical protein TWF594_006878 [Orbilia oligospora]
MICTGILFSAMSLQPNQNWSDFEQLGFRSQLWLTIKRKFAKKDAGHVESIFYAAESKAAEWVTPEIRHLMNPPIGLQLYRPRNPGEIGSFGNEYRFSRISATRIMKLNSLNFGLAFEVILRNSISITDKRTSSTYHQTDAVAQ